MVIDNKYFVGGLNSDDEDRVIPNGDYRYALNIRNSKSDSDSQGSIENVKGNTITSVYFGAGNYKCIGAYDDKLNNKVYWFVYSDQLNHLIMEFDVVSNTTQVVIYGAALNFQEDKLIIEQNIAIIDGLMYFNDTFNPPRKINIAKEKQFAINGTGGGVGGFDSLNIQAVKQAPRNPPTLKYASNLNIKTNNIRAKLFQFRYKFVYEDNEESAWSPISKTAIPNTDDSSTLAQNENKYRPFSYYDTSLNNYIKVSVDMPNSILVKKIKIAFREQNTGDFYLAEDKKIIDIPLGSSTYDFDFYNNESYTSIDNDGNTGMRLFDNVPLLSNTQSLIDGNRIAYGGITEGYDPIEVDMDIKPIYSTTPRTPQVYFVVSGGSLANPQIAFGSQYNVNPTLFFQYDSYPQPPFSTIIAAIVVNGITYYLGQKALGGAVAAIGSDIMFVKNATSGSGYQPLTDILKQEYVIGNSNIQEGTRFTVSVDIRYFDYSTGGIISYNPKIQIVAAAGDGAFEIGNKIKAQLLTFNTSTTFIDISLFDIQVYQGGWVFGFNSNVVTSTDVVVQFKVKAVLKQLPPPQIVNVGGYDTFGVPSSLPHLQTACALVSCSSDLKVYSDWTLITEKSLKNGANHGVGLVYYDFANRSGLTNISKTKLFYVPYPTENNTARPLVPNGHYISSTDLELTINHKAPNWATHYQVVYTGNQTVENIQNSTGYKGFIQFKIDTYANSVIIGAVQCKISELQQFNNETPESVDIGYGYSKGDRIRFLMDANGDYLTQYIDVEIISYDSGTGVLTFKKPNATVGSGYTVEIYTPKKQIDNTFYYEVGEVFSIDTDGQHSGDSQNQIFDSSGTLLQPAKLLLTDIGDVYMRFRVKPTERQIEDYHYSDYYKSDSWDKGRPNIVDNNIKQIYRPTTIRYSQPYIPETNINGLSRFDDFDFEAYDQQYGDIRLLYSSDRLLNVFQRLKVGRVGISQSTIYSADGTSAAVSRVDKVLNEIIYHAGEYGIGDNPESFAVYGNSKYFVDVKRGVVCRLGGDGITPISEYKMHNYFTDLFEALDTNSAPYKVFGVYDFRFDEYIIHITNETIQETIAFSEAKNRWVSYYSYFPDFMVSNRTGLITFNQGQLYRHNTNTLYNNFYGFQYTSQIKFISNVEPNKIKVFTNITEDASDVWNMVEATNQYGQRTSLEEEDFEDVEGVYKASLLKDENTPNVTNALIEGDEMRSHSLAITLENDTTDFSKLFSVGVGVTLSELTNR